MLHKLFISSLLPFNYSMGNVQEIGVRIPSLESLLRENLYVCAGVQAWRERLQQKPLPLVIEEERYYRSGIQRKLGFSRKLTRTLLKADALHLQSPRYRKKPVDNKSLAGLISWATGRQSEEVLISEKYFGSTSFQAMPLTDQISIIDRAYTGTHWFEKLRRRWMQKTTAGTQLLFYPRQQIGRRELADLLDVAESSSAGGLTKAFRFLGGKRKCSKSLHNTAPLENVAMFLSYLCNVPVEKILRSNPAEKLAGCFVKRKLLPFVLQHNIGLHQYYSLARAADSSGTTYPRLFYAVQRARIPNARVLGRTPYVNGLELALYALKHTERQSWTPQDVADLFGTEQEKTVELAALTISRRGTISRHHYVFPLYERVASCVRKEIYGQRWAQPIQVRKRTFYLSVPALIEYCRQYGLEAFDHDCREHLEKELADTVSGRKDFIESLHPLRMASSGKR